MTLFKTICKERPSLQWPWAVSEGLEIESLELIINSVRVMNEDDSITYIDIVLKDLDVFVVVASGNIDVSSLLEVSAI